MKTLGVRISDEEEELLEKAAEIDTQLGERGGVSSWVRRAALREAQRVVDAQVEEGEGKH